MVAPAQGGRSQCQRSKPTWQSAWMAPSGLSPCTAWENAVWAANNSSKEGRTEDVEGVEARLGRCQDTTRRVMRPAMARAHGGWSGLATDLKIISTGIIAEAWWLSKASGGKPVAKTEGILLGASAF